ncbi:hypothetical protein CYMTET_8829 [Cymbomonas tetramitiformis]|uniref:Vesicle transport protein n=1 Tax=Cymbomonas tetramitiformis TaxID=36881 RepID=A0AAE0LG37_9CHLO|nr:hypothetical protein CYMTET_8829 [Cymbomonas tetramitiformis]
MYGAFPDNNDSEKAQKAVKSKFDQLKTMVGLQAEPQEPDFFEELGDMFSLSKKERLYGFLICISIGIFLSLLASLFYLNPVIFASCYTLGNVIAIASTGFLVGFYNQMANMFTPHRLVASCIYIFMMGLTLYCAFGLKNGLLCLVCVFLQSLALTWYCLSYIPYARKLIKKCLGAVIGEDLDF